MLNLTLASVGKKKFPDYYIDCKSGIRVYFIFGSYLSIYTRLL